MNPHNNESWKHPRGEPIGDHWTIRECDGVDGCTVIECFAKGADDPVKDIHVPDHLIPSLIQSLHERLDEIGTNR